MSEVKENNQKSSYRGIFKATSIFGGVQVYQILIELIKSKVVALLLGPAGVGIQGLYTTGTQMIQQLSSFGLSSSAVRNVSEASANADTEKIKRVVSALRKLVWLTGFLGMFAVIALSPVLSKTSFGDTSHFWGFIALSVTLLFYQLTAGQKVILQGTRQFKYLAKCTTYGVTLGLIICVPLYYLWGVEAIVPNLIVGSITGYVLGLYFSRKVAIESVSLSIKETFQIGKSMLVMGLTMCITQFFAYASTFIINSCIRSWGGVDEVGLYTAGALLMTQYTGLVFQAMGTDYYPRLSAVNKDNEKCKVMMNQQGEVGLLLLGPLMTLCVIFIPIIIRILFTETFEAINGYVICCSIGVIFQMASWAISYVFIAKADSKLFAINEIVACIYGLALNLIGYKLAGLTGMGVSFIVKYILYLTQVYIISHRRYSFTFDRAFIRLFILELLFVISSVAIVGVFTSFCRYVVGALLSSIIVYISYRELNRRMDLSEVIRARLSKNR